MSYRIFVVEDHPVMRDAYAQVLGEESDLELVGAVASTEEAITALAETPCDLVVTDYRLPGQTGIDLVRHLKVLLPGLPVVVISAHEEGAFARTARLAGAADFLSKRDLCATLVPTIRRILSLPQVAGA